MSINEKYKKSKKHSKSRSKKQHKKQKTVKAVTNTRTKCQNKVNGKKCYSKTSVQRFSEEGQIFCNDCKNAYGRSGGWTRLRVAKIKKKEQKENAIVPHSNEDSQIEKDSENEQTDT